MAYNPKHDDLKPVRTRKLPIRIPPNSTAFTAFSEAEEYDLVYENKKEVVLRPEGSQQTKGIRMIVAKTTSI